MSGSEKDYLFALCIPSIDKEVGDLERNHKVLKASFIAQGLKGEEFKAELSLDLTLLNHDE